MSVPLYMDHHVPSAVTEGLRRRGVDVLTCFDDGTATWEDEPILQRATQLGRAIYTQDEDYLALSHDWNRSRRDHAGVIYAHQLSITIGEAITHLELIALALDPDDLRNQVVFIPFS